MKITGFTLFETIIYCALFSMLMTSALLTTNTLMDTAADTKINIAIIAEASFINQKLTWVFMNASHIENVNSEMIKITRPDLQIESPLRLEFKNNSIYLTRGIATSNILVQPRFVLILESISYKDSQISIRYSLDDEQFQFDAYVP